MSTWVEDLVEAIWRLIRFAYGADIHISFAGAVTKLVAAPAKVRDEHLKLISDKLSALYSTSDDDLMEAAFAYNKIVEMVKECRNRYWIAVAIQRKHIASAEAALCAAARKGDFRQVFHLAERVEHLSKELDRALWRE